MLIPLTVHRRESGRGIILYSSAYEARPSQGHVEPLVLLLLQF
jgi:hypothetical protein